VRTVFLKVEKHCFKVLKLVSSFSLFTH